MTKARFAVPEQRPTAQRVLAHALDVLMRLLHPMMPFLTEEVWQLLAQVAPERGLGEPGGPPPRPVATKTPGSGTTRLAAAESVCIAAWPTADPSWQDATIEEQFADFQAVLRGIRDTRNVFNVPLKDEISFLLRCDSATAALLEPMQPYFAQMAKANATAIGPNVTGNGHVAVTIAGQRAQMEVHIDLSRYIDWDAERKRLEKQRDNVTKQIGSVESKLANKNFVEKAPAEVIQQQRDKLNELCNQLKSIESALANLPK
jgi:valyl-tRNA synthetase